ncbi:hypothetical protein AE42_03120 [Enterobacter kobei]|nr:hypothetical protein D9T11_14045 [Enterobacter kobei]KDF42775.1 hypothetical protein AE42_03120 [Enterobacter kobei]
MILTSRAKCIIRWGSILSISLIYIATILISVLDYGITKKYTDILNAKTITVEGCNAVIFDFEQYYFWLINVSLFGYIISTVMIILVFKKVR